MNDYKLLYRQCALRFLLFLPLFTATSNLAAAPPEITRFIRLDQFGYYCTATKIAVLANPQAGFDAADSFLPGTGTDQYQVRKWSNDDVVFTGTLQPWNSGNIHAQSGDQGWYFDFSALSDPGLYYIFDLANNAGSYAFEISAEIYDDVFYHTFRFYFYQRCNFAKSTPYADSRWTDAAAFERSNQDRFARSRYAKNDPSTERDVSGGWFDAGDYNKYVTFALQPTLVLLDAFVKWPGAFTDAMNIPESGNGRPDVLDELKFEIDWLIKMQDATGTHGLLLKVGADNYDNTLSPPSADAHPRYYVPECTSATISGAAVFAAASIIFKGYPDWLSYASDLKTRAENAWARAAITTNQFTTFETQCDDQDIKSGDADENEAWQRAALVVAAIYLYEANMGSGNESEYRNYVESNYNLIDPVANGWWGPYNLHVENALLHYTTLPGINASVAGNIRNSKTGSNTGMGIVAFDNRTDLYLSHMHDAQYHWGSAQVKASLAVNLQNLDYYDLAPSNDDAYQNVAEHYLHWFHGLNATGQVMITHMEDYGGDSCIHEVYHSWFADGSIYDNSETSAIGPAPGFIPGGPNKNYAVTQISPPYNQPPQKSYRDWNTGWNGSFQEASYEVTEVSIYGQAAYVSMLAGIIANGPAPNTCQIPLRISASHFSAWQVPAGVKLTWAANSPALTAIEKSTDGHNFKTLIELAGTLQTYTDPGPAQGMNYYRLKFTDQHGQFFYSLIRAVEVNQNITAAWHATLHNETLDLNLPGLQGQHVQLALYDLDGTPLLKRKLQVTNENVLIHTDIHLQPAIYILQLTQGGKDIFLKLIKTD